MAKVLILDQSKSMRNTLRERLEFEGFSTEAAEDEEAASTMCEKIPFDVILSDRGCKIPDAGIPFIVLSAEASIDSAVEAVRNGAQDYLTKPIDMNRLLQSIHRTIDNPAPAPACAPAAAPARRSRRSRNMHTEQIIGTSPQMEHVRQLIDKVAPCEARVLITGENGTGKELVARWLHAKSSRAAAPFVEVNCAAIPSELIESELFGHEKGAFTSAIKQRKGKFEQADGGTLFMDEIGDMSLAAQAKVLRALQENKICRVGSDKDITTLFRRAKGVVEAMPRYTHMEAYTLRQVEKPVWADTVVWLNLYLGEEHIGDLALLSKKVSMECGIKNLAVMLLELDMDALIPFRSRTNTFTHLPAVSYTHLTLPTIRLV